MIYGYIRVSSDKQTVENQRFEINNFCQRHSMHIDGWIEETISGTKAYNKRELGKLLKRVQQNDLIICAELSRLGRNLFMIMEILNICMNKECRVWTIKDNYRLGDDIQSKVLAFAFGLSAEIERNLISQRTKEALARKRQEGVVLGRPKGRRSAPNKYKLYAKRNLICEMLKANISKRKIAELCKVDRKTLCRFIANVLNSGDNTNDEQERWQVRSDYVGQNAACLSFRNADSWVILSPIEQSIKRKIEAVGTPLKDWDININYGIKTGYNDAFIITTDKRNEILDNCETEDERKRTEELIRPILRGRDIKRYSYDWAGLWLIYIPWHFPYHLDEGIQGASQKAEQAFHEQYPSVYAHMLQYKKPLSERNKAETGIRYEWYAMQRWGAKYWEDFFEQKVVWARLMRLTQADINSFPRFCVVPEGMFVVDSLCFFTGRNISTICAALNSEYATWYFFNNVATLDNGGFQMRQQYVEEIPFPICINSPNNIDKCIYEGFGFSKDEVKFIQDAIAKKKKEILNNRH